ncbi:MAG: 4-(cytidine 5'-diphospho)-2-C-methyl-D-erythritol kinase [Thermoclostridium sp.]|nr:4-(cytidine 5'-diphospho)-2-C-methyl-D-erythritol kinase [Thermoclostridium sp.]
MKFLTMSAPAKINLSLDITGKLDNGYHSLEMILQTISLKDEISLEKQNESIAIECNHPFVPLDDRNICSRAARAFFLKTGIQGGVKIRIDKKIPIGAGLAGGSTNAAATLKGLNALYDVGLSGEDLIELGLQCGADVPFCLAGGTCLARGIGEKLTPLPALRGLHAVLIMPDFSVSTAWVYQNYRMDDPVRHPNTQAIVAAIRQGDIARVAREMKNVLESVTAVKYPEIEGIKRDLKNRGALGSMMSGSGPSVFGLFSDAEQAQRAFSILQNQYENIWLVTT